MHTEKTDSAVIELMRELKDIRRDRRITPEEFNFAKASLTKRLPRQFETAVQRAVRHRRGG